MLSKRNDDGSKAVSYVNEDPAICHLAWAKIADYVWNVFIASFRDSIDNVQVKTL